MIGDCGTWGDPRPERPDNGRNCDERGVPQAPRDCLVTDWEPSSVGRSRRCGESVTVTSVGRSTEKMLLASEAADAWLAEGKQMEALLPWT